jgi:hypothetical protein
MEDLIPQKKKLIFETKPEKNKKLKIKVYNDMTPYKKIKAKKKEYIKTEIYDIL